MILKLRSANEGGWIIWDNIERINFWRVPLEEAKGLNASWKMIIENNKNNFDDQHAKVISIIQGGKETVIVSNSFFIYLLNDEGKTIDSI